MAAPIASAGSNQTVDPGELVTLDASGSSDPDGHTLSYVWQQLSGTTVTLSSVGAVQPTFTAPATPQDLLFRVVVDDSNGDGPTISSPVTITVAGAVTAPTADAGSNINDASVGVLVTLDGSGSTDPDDLPLTYAWTVAEVPAGSGITALTNTTTANPSFTPDVAGIYRFTLTVNNGTESSAPDNVFVTAIDPATIPVADAGENQNDAVYGEVITLDGSGSTDDVGVTSYLWSQLGGPTVTLSSTTSAQPTFTAPTGTNDEILVLQFSLIVEDADGNRSEPAAVAVLVNPPNTAPVAVTSGNFTVNWGETVMLDASGSSDADGDDLTYVWVQLAGPTVTLSDIEAMQPTFTAPNENTQLDFGLIVRDTAGATSSPALSIVTVEEANEIPVANAGTAQIADADDIVTLDGSGSTDADGDDLTYAWSQLSGTPVTLSSYSAAQPTFTAPALAVADTLVFQLVVNDGRDSSAPDTVDIDINATGYDSQPPRITLYGPASYEIGQGGTYTEVGASAYDSYDGVVAVTISGTVDTATLGTYIVTYNATDAAGNLASVQRTVKVVDPTTFKDHSVGDFHSAGPTTPGQPVEDDPLLAETFVDGELVRIGWADINPAPGVFIFSDIQRRIDLAAENGKTISLGIVDGDEAPQWLKDASETFTFIFREGAPDQQTFIACLPWDANYLRFKSELVTALGNAFDSNPTLTTIYFSYAAMTNGLEFHWRVDEAAYTAAGYTQEKLLASAKTVLDNYIGSFPKTPIAIEGHTVFESEYVFESLYDYGHSLIGGRLGIGLWWLASRIVLNTSGNDHDTVIWPIAVRCQQQGGFIIGQTVGNFTERPDRFDSGEGWTSEEAFTHERLFFNGGNADDITIDCWELWTKDLQNPSIVALIDSVVPPDPVAKAGLDVTAEPGEQITLDGTASESPLNLPLTYTWQQLSGISITNTLTGADTATPTFTAPYSPTETVIVMELVVSDGNNTGRDTVSITVPAIDTDEHEALFAKVGFSQQAYHIGAYQGAGNTIALKFRPDNAYPGVLVDGDGYIDFEANSITKAEFHAGGELISSDDSGDSVVISGAQIEIKPGQLSLQPGLYTDAAVAVYFAGATSGIFLAGPASPVGMLLTFRSATGA